MKSIQSTLVVLALLIAGPTFAQKVKKTYDHTKFAKKVLFSFTPQYVNAWSPDDKAIKYISDKSEKSVEEVKASVEANKASIKADVKQITDAGVGMILKTVDVNVVQESPVKVADLVLNGEYNGTAIIYTLKNCVQTDISWYLGDRIIPSGDGLEALVDMQQGLKDKQEAAAARTDSLNALYAGSTASTEAANPSYKYFGQTRNVTDADQSKRYFDFDLIGKPVRGYIIKKDGTKVDCIIKQQDPETLQNPTSTLLLYNLAHTDAGYTEDETNNFKSAQMKNELRAFFVGGNMYVNDGEQWSILMREGAIREIVRLVPTEVNGKKVYLVGKIVQKLEGPLINETNLNLVFKNTMSEWVKDNPEMAEKIKNKAEGYKWSNAASVIVEYNKWYEEKYPEQAPYVLKPK